MAGASAAPSGRADAFSADAFSAGPAGAPSVPISSGQMRCQSSGRGARFATVEDSNRSTFTKGLPMSLPRIVIERIEGLSLAGHAPEPKNGLVQVNALVRTPQGQSQQTHLEVPLLDALYLLNMLEAMSKDANLDHLRRPPPGAPQ